MLIGFAAESVIAFSGIPKLQRHAADLKQNPQAWMPWNYQAALKATDAAGLAA